MRSRAYGVVLALTLAAGASAGAQSADEPTAAPVRTVVLDFVKVPVLEIVRELGQRLEMRIDVNGAMDETGSLFSEAPVPASEAREYLKAFLQLKGFRVVERQDGSWSVAPG